MSLKGGMEVVLVYFYRLMLQENEKTSWVRGDGKYSVMTAIGRLKRFLIP
jgi:hypothetical protein